MANATILYACLANGLAIFNKPGTSSEWLPPRIVLQGRAVFSAWAEPGPPIRVVAACGSPEGAARQVLLSENGGRDWESTLDAPVTALLGLEGQPARLYAGLEGGGLAGSLDEGNDWGVLPDTGASTIHSIMRPGLSTSVPGEPDLFYAVADNLDGDRVLLEGNPEEGDWRTLPADAVNALSWDEQTGDLLAATARGVELSADNGATWALLPGSPEDCRAIVVIPGPAGANPSIVVGTPSDLLVSNDAGASWESLNLPESGVSALVRDPERRDRLYAATSTGHIFESGNRGHTWQPVNREPIAPVGYLYVIRI